ncbi:CoA transferase, partial [Streptomyces sp. A7024]|nr:CoA transferase [Streptomyces coryli]
RFSQTPGTVRRPPAQPGAHAAEIAAEWNVPALNKEDQL